MQKPLSLVFFLLFALSGMAQTNDLMIVEYQDFDPGDGFQIRLYNPTNQSLNLGDYYLQVFNNGNLSASSSRQLSGSLAPQATILVGNSHSCSSDLSFNVAGVNNNDCIAITLGNSLNFIDMINLYGVDVRPKVDGQTNAMYHKRLLRLPSNCTRYTSVDGSSSNSWSNNPNTNNVGWQVFGTACLSTSSNFSLAPSMGFETLDICEGDSVFLQNAWRKNAGVYYDTLAGASLCDSVVETSVTLRPAPTATRSYIVCSPNEVIHIKGVSYGVGHHSLQVVNLVSCDSLIHINVQHQGLLADFNWLYNPLDSNEIFFEQLSLNHSRAEWHFGDGSHQEGMAPQLQHRYAVGGLYPVTLKVYNQAGCADSLQLMVFIPLARPKPETPIYIPNVFSPNGDGLNDTYKITAMGVAQLHFQIFNRWGQLLYESTAPNFEWDGTFNGTPCTEGVYMYYLHSPEARQGFITLVR